jgi:hypothetical protein
MPPALPTPRLWVDNDERLKTLNEGAPTKRGKALVAAEKLGIDIAVFDSDFTVEPCVAGAPDFAHPTCAQWGEDFMWAKWLVRRKRHFFISAVQFVTTVSGAFGSVSTTALIRNRCPLSVTA